MVQNRKILRINIKKHIEKSIKELLIKGYENME